MFAAVDRPSKRKQPSSRQKTRYSSRRPTTTDHAHTRAIAKPQVNHRTAIKTPFRRLASPQTLLALVLAWDSRGREAYEEWLELRSATERALALLAPQASAQPQERAVRSRPLRQHDELVGPRRELADELRRLKVEAGNPSLRELGKKTRVHASSLSGYLTGNRLPSAEILGEFVQALGADADTVRHFQDLRDQAERAHLQRVEGNRQ
ncbi:helix-turn-helix domain-containing protein [Streptomyces sp. NPDC001520]|uniref:helix-turn-helix domain-containing protein n=1 Tax=Streptomyces sp. NPDC001520 TaxID=3364581 RepID=UPI0036D1A3CE